MIQETVINTLVTDSTHNLEINELSTEDLRNSNKDDHETELEQYD